MNYNIPFNEWPEEIDLSTQLTPEEKNKPLELENLSHKKSAIEVRASIHEKSAKNSKEKVERKSYQKLLKERFKKPLRRGDKIQNMQKKNRNK